MTMGKNEIFEMGKQYATNRKSRFMVSLSDIIYSKQGLELIR